MLRYFWSEGLVYYSEKEVTDWQEGIRESCQLLIEKKIIKATYVEEIIKCIKMFGPYSIVAPNVAMPHASSQSDEVLGTAVSFTKLKSPVNFGDPEKKAQLFFTLAAKDSTAHLKNIQRLSELLMKERVIDSLMATESIEDYLKVMRRYES